jgi:exopolysaccharide biosynthesis polyprenyl glycosylphosphotransferase
VTDVTATWRVRAGPTQLLAYRSPRRLLSNLGLFVYAVDVLSLAIAGRISIYARFGRTEEVVAGSWQESNLAGLSYFLVTVVLVAVWLVIVWLCGGYQLRLIGSGSEEFKAVLLGTVVTCGLVSLICYLGRIEIARGFVAVAFPLGLTCLLLGRVASRQTIRYWRRHGRLNHRVVLVGTPDGTSAVSAVLSEDKAVGFDVTAVCLVDPDYEVGRSASSSGLEATPRELLAAAGLADLEERLREGDVDTVMVGALGHDAERRLRMLAWALEGTGLALVVVPTLTDVAGPRIHIHPVAGLPLLHVEAPVFRGARRLAKVAMDRIGSLVLLVVLLPLWLAIAALIHATSDGPVLFRQPRVGLHGKEYRCFKFRTMVQGAEHLRESLLERNECDGVLFKVRRDPRVTPLGRILRRYSLDELPQLLNVLAGQMSLVGPRPPLPDEVARYGQDMRRRLMVKPGMTGLWQVSGRADLSWTDSVRLDLYYVENWSLSGDLAILLRTFLTVLRGTGAY